MEDYVLSCPNGSQRTPEDHTFCSCLDISLSLSSSYHHQTYKLTGRTKEEVKTLHLPCADIREQWACFLSLTLTLTLTQGSPPTSVL